MFEVDGYRRPFHCSLVTPWQLRREASSSSSRSFLSSTTGATATAEAPPAIDLRAIAYSGLTKDEFQILREMVESVCWESIGLSVVCEYTNNAGLHCWQQETPTASPRMKGALGRVLVLHTNLDEESIETLEYAFSEQMDGLLYSEPPMLVQPVLVKLQNPTVLVPSATFVDDSIDSSSPDEESRLRSLMEQELDMYELNKAVVDVVYEHDETTNSQSSKGSAAAAAACPTIHVELDAADVTDAYSSTTWWDTSTVLVFDDLVNEDLRKQLLQVVLGPNAEHWNDSQDGPDPKRWVRGGLQDTPDEEDGDDPTSASVPLAECWGLSDDAVQNICFEEHDAIEEFERILAERVFPQFVVSRLPEAVFGACVSPLTANAPTYGDHFDYHIDGDPNLTPPSPWTDIYGRYPNRLKGKPRFMSCLVYLNDEWEAMEWGAPTRFLDLPTSQSYDVLPKPGRCVFMDQDVSHTVVAPDASAAKRPRYSMVWKLILHPREDLQDMTNLAVDRAWPEPILFGSAKSSITL